MPWAVVEHKQDDGEVLTHILPVIPVTDFKTKREAVEFREKCIAAGSPVLTDEDDQVTATYFGHTLSTDCACCPKKSETDPGLYAHNQFQ